MTPTIIELNIHMENPYIGRKQQQQVRVQVILVLFADMGQNVEQLMMQNIDQNFRIKNRMINISKK
jgi:hypothetical protein